MPGLDLNQLSSNWKKLQGQLRTEKRTETAGHGLKRKRPIERTEKLNGHKKTKLSRPLSRPTEIHSKMGSYISKPTPDGYDHDQPTRKANGATSATTPDALFRNQTLKDEINTGLHPTNRPGKYISLDCEMVGTGPPPHNDHVLARVSLVNYHGLQLYDSYVLPPPNITVHDYRTHVSGVREEHLQPSSARPFSQVQADVARLLDGRVLIGHALRNDLTVLQLSHPRRNVRDTSSYAPLRKKAGGFGKPSLRHLARKVLGVEIQGGEHSSLEDARAAMGLYRVERVGWEEEVRRRFGAGAGKVNGKGRSKSCE